MSDQRGNNAPHEKVDVYQVSTHFVAVAVTLSGQLPKGYAPLAESWRTPSSWWFAWLRC